MLFRILVPLVLLCVLLPVVYHWPAFARYGGRWTREVPALVLCVAIYFAIWLGVSAAIRAAVGSVAASFVIPSLVALATLPLSLWIGFKIAGVKPVLPPHQGGVH